MNLSQGMERGALHCDELFLGRTTGAARRDGERPQLTGKSPYHTLCHVRTYGGGATS